MNWQRLEGSWKQFKGTIQEKWGKLTDSEFDRIAGRREQLLGKLQEEYGLAKEEAEQQLHELLDHQLQSLEQRQKEEAGVA
jgi:uncharacterized protein YjbJ (UPF0337 family)